MCNNKKLCCTNSNVDDKWSPVPLKLIGSGVGGTGVGGTGVGGTDVAVATGPESARSVSVFSIVVDPHPMVIITIRARMTNLNNIDVSSLVLLPSDHDLVIVGSIADLLQCSDFVYNVGLKEFC